MPLWTDPDLWVPLNAGPLYSLGAGSGPAHTSQAGEGRDDAVRPGDTGAPDSGPYGGTPRDNS